MGACCPGNGKDPVLALLTSKLGALNEIFPNTTLALLVDCDGEILASITEDEKFNNTTSQQDFVEIIQSLRLAVQDFSSMLSITDISTIHIQSNSTINRLFSCYDISAQISPRTSNGSLSRRISLSQTSTPPPNLSISNSFSNLSPFPNSHTSASSSMAHEPPLFLAFYSNLDADTVANLDLPAKDKQV